LDVEFPSIREAMGGKQSLSHLGFVSSKNAALVMGCLGSVRAENFISMGMFKLAKSQEREWRKQQAEEIKAMMFRSLQPKAL
jgi:hypothetical protein